ncbi:hypothetical protein J2X07_001076 [Fictibacillus barbaricus]|uniref:Uncharacterized protein n=1 Tax=Fictibacillus barbaricus TaxID=182136 RepID=A0ABU1TY04_9BACL|nr:hypothetical protein [Fictibacillus barbaricus]
MPTYAPKNKANEEIHSLSINKTKKSAEKNSALFIEPWFIRNSFI